VSFLLSERRYCNELIRLGYEDAMKRRDEIRIFLAATSAENKVVPQ
jgi:hypothetical protein